MVRLAIAVIAVLLAVPAAGAPGRPARAPSRAAAPAARPHATLSTLPLHVYKVTDALDTQEPSEAWYFHLVVADSTRRLTPRSATIAMFGGPALWSTTTLGAQELAAIRGITFRRRGVDECFDLRHHFREPEAGRIDRLRYDLELEDEAGRRFRETLEIPVGAYAQKTRLICPVRGNFVVTNGTVTEGGHHERSQAFAYDIIGLGPFLEWLRHGDGTRNEDFAGWGREVVAPGAGVVVYSRNDVPDNRATGASDIAMLLALPEPEWSVAGNVVVIDHENGEFSCFGHMQKGSVRVKRGDRVRQGQPIGRLGNSGHSQGPHLHYHLMDGPRLYQADGLPARFDNVDGGMPIQGLPAEAK